LKEIQTHAQLELIPGLSSVYGEANHQGARAKGYQADRWTWDQLGILEEALHSWDQLGILEEALHS